MPEARRFNEYILYDLSVDRQDRVEHFLQRLHQGEKGLATEMVKDYFEPDRPLAPTVALIPIAAHQESPETVAATLGLYAAQQTDEPFTVMALLNTPQGGLDTDNAKAVVTACNTARKTYQNLDLRFAAAEFEKPTIGMIRRSLWNAAVTLALHDGLFEDSRHGDVIAMNHDIDTVRMSPNYVKRVQEHYARKRELYDRLPNLNQQLLPATTQARHAIPTSHPNIGKAVFWTDYMHHLSRHDGGFEASLVVPLGHYVDTEGFLPESVTYETRELTEAVPIQMIPRTFMSTSPRRYIERLQHNNFGEIWTTDSFHATDPCREERDLPDITHDRLVELVFDSLDADIEYQVLEGAVGWEVEQRTTRQVLRAAGGLCTIEPGEFIRDTYADTERRVATRLSMVQRVLRNVIGSEELASLVASTYDAKFITQQLVRERAGDITSILRTLVAIDANHEPE